MPSEPTLLAFDTSAAHCAAVLLRRGEIAAHRYEEMARGQAEFLMPMLETLLDAEKLTWRDLDALGVGIGPGNFTGIRISVAAARGLALGLSIPAIGVSGFEVARHTTGTDASGRVFLPAPRQCRYVQVFRTGQPDGEPRFEQPTALQPFGPPQAIDWNATGIAALAALAAAKLETGQSLPPPAPLYVRPADAAPARDAGPVILD